MPTNLIGLTCHRIDDKKGLCRTDRILYCFDLIHHLLVDSKTAGRVDNHKIVAVAFGVIDGMTRDLYRIFISVFSIDRNID